MEEREKWARELRDALPRSLGRVTEIDPDDISPEEGSTEDALFYFVTPDLQVGGVAVYEVNDPVLLARVRQVTPEMAISERVLSRFGAVATSGYTGDRDVIFPDLMALASWLTECQMRDRTVLTTPHGQPVAGPVCVRVRLS